MSKYLKEGKDLFEEAQSKTISLKSSYDNSILTSKERKYNINEALVEPIKYEKPQYKEVKNTYEVLKPITKHMMELPKTVNKKVKTTNTIYNKEIIVSNEQELNQILNGNNLFQEVPLPSKSTIQNLIKDSFISYSNNNEIKLGNQNILTHSHNEYNTNINNNKNTKKEEKANVEYKNKNFIETFFHDDDIPQPTVCEGNALVFSELKENNNSKEEKNNKSIKSSESNNSSNNVKQFLDELPVENTIILSKQPNIDNMLYKSDNSGNINSFNIKANEYNKHPLKEKLSNSQVLKYNNNKINENEIKKNKGFISNINESPLPEIDINNSKNYNNNTKQKINKIKPVMELNNKTNNNKKKLYSSYFPTKYNGGNLISKTSEHINSKDNNKINLISDINKGFKNK